MLKKSLLLLSFSSLIIANTTMCYKQNWSNPATIETVKLDGGKCLSKNSIQDMQNNGWSIKDIKVNASQNNSGMDYMYILTKTKILKRNIGYINDTVSKDSVYDDNTYISPNSQMTKANYNTFKKYEEEEKKEKALKKKKEEVKKASSLYEKECQSCHGKKGEIEAYNSSRALNSLTKEEFTTALWEYYMDQKDNGFAIIMKPISERLTKDNIKNIYNYLQTIK